MVSVACAAGAGAPAIAPRSRAGGCVCGYRCIRPAGAERSAGGNPNVADPQHGGATLPAKAGRRGLRGNDNINRWRPVSSARRPVSYSRQTRLVRNRRWPFLPGASPVFEFTSLGIRMSSACSATIFLSSLFSRFSSLSRLSWLSSSPPYLLFHRNRWAPLCRYPVAYRPPDCLLRLRAKSAGFLLCCIASSWFWLGFIPPPELSLNPLQLRWIRSVRRPNSSRMYILFRG